MGNQDQFNVFGLQVIISVLIFGLRKNSHYLGQNVTNHQNYCSTTLHILPWLNSNFPHVIKKFPTITAGSNFCVCSNIFPHTTTVHMILNVYMYNMAYLKCYRFYCRRKPIYACHKSEVRVIYCLLLHRKK